MCFTPTKHSLRPQSHAACFTPTSAGHQSALPDWNPDSITPVEFLLPDINSGRLDEAYSPVNCKRKRQDDEDNPVTTAAPDMRLYQPIPASRYCYQFSSSHFEPVTFGHQYSSAPPTKRARTTLDQQPLEEILEILRNMASHNQTTSTSNNNTSVLHDSSNADTPSTIQATVIKQDTNQDLSTSSETLPNLQDQQDFRTPEDLEATKAPQQATTQHGRVLCNVCNKTYASKRTLKQHMKIHSGSKPYRCDYCGKTFTDRSTRNKHARIHTGFKPHVCTYCNAAFGQSGNLLRHQRLKHPFFPLLS